MSVTATKTKKPAWTRGTVTVMVRETLWTPKGRKNETTSTREIEADLWESFAVHKTITPWVYGWDITHVPTGYAMFHGARTKAAAKAFCREVMPLWDWASLTTPESIHAMPVHITSLMLEAARRAWP